jgi:hypothetical protein
MADPAPVLARLATAVKYQGTGIGKAILRSAMDKLNGAAEVVGAACLLVHVKPRRPRELPPSYSTQCRRHVSPPTHIIGLPTNVVLRPHYVRSSNK